MLKVNVHKLTKFLVTIFDYKRQVLVEYENMSSAGGAAIEIFVRLSQFGAALLDIGMQWRILHISRDLQTANVQNKLIILLNIIIIYVSIKFLHLLAK